MTLYLIYFAVIFAAYMFIYGTQNTAEEISPEKHRRRDLFMVLISVGLWTLLVGLRSQEMGVDLDGYLPSYQAIGKLSFADIWSLRSFLNYEKGYILLNKLLYMISPEPQLLLIVCTLVSVVPVGILIYKKSRKPFFSFLVYLGLPVMLVPFSALRQGIAVGITVLSWFFVEKKKPVKFIITVLFASFFHRSAIFFLIAYPLCNMRLKGVWQKIWKYGTVILIPVAFLLRNQIYTLLAGLFYEDAPADNNGAYMLFIVFTAIYIFCLAINDRDDDSVNGYLNLFWIACICQSMGGLKSTAQRVGYYFMIYLAVALPNILTPPNTKVEKKLLLIMRCLILLIFAGYAIYTLSTATWAECNPYSFFWQD